MATLNCEWCGDKATHFCGACGKWICSKAACKAKSVAHAAKRLVGAA